MILLTSLVGALLSRWHGGGFPLLKASKSVKNIIWAIPISAVVVSSTLYEVNYLILTFMFILSLGLCIAGKATGHGRVWNPYLPLDLSKKPEELEKPLFWLFEKGILTSFWYKVAVLGLIGLASVSGPAILLLYFNPLYSLIIALGGLWGKPLSYLIGWKLTFIKNGNEVAEYLSGGIAYLGLGIVYSLITNL